jgi:hypothetical protein
MRAKHIRAGLTILIAAVLLVLSSCSVVTGSGKVATETREVTGFNTIELAANGDLVVTPGETESLTIEADDNVIPSLTSEVSGGTLKLGTKPNTRIQTTNPMIFRVTVTELTRLSLSGSGSIAGNDLALRTLNVDISGAGTVKLAGTTDEQAIALSGSGRYEAQDFASQRATADVSGSGEITVAVSQELNVNISGSGTVTYSGDPKVQSQVSGSGRVVKQ